MATLIVKHKTQEWKILDTFDQTDNPNEKTEIETIWRETLGPSYLLKWIENSETNQLTT